MSRLEKATIVVTTYPNTSEALKASKKFVEKKLAACATQIKVRSLYVWKNSLEDSSEVLVLFKTLTKKAGELAGAVAREHPYVVPEIMEIKPSRVGRSYLKWLSESLSDEPSMRHLKPKQRQQSTQS